MAIHDYDGTTKYEINKLYDNDGTTSYQIGAVYDYDETTSSLIYLAPVTLTNKVGTYTSVGGSTGNGDYDYIDITASYDWYEASRTYSITANHRYYIRWKGTHYGGAYEYMDEELFYEGGGVTDSIVQSALGTVVHRIIKPTRNGTLTIGARSYAYTDATTSSYIDTYIYVIVDITELETALGYEFATPADFRTYIGSANFFGDKEFSV